MSSEFGDAKNSELKTSNPELFMLWQQLANGIAIGSVYALISLGLTSGADAPGDQGGPVAGGAARPR